jgi:hypothetical protein
LRKWAEAHEIQFINGDAGNPANQERIWVVVPGNHELANSVAMLALEEYRRENTVTPDKLRAVYVRPSDAEIPKPWQRQR